jgi:butyryl-CoA dehydrogenase
VTTAATARADLSDAALARVTQALAANAGRYDRTAEFPWESVHAVHDAGLLTVGIGAAYGGHDLSLTDTARVLQALGKGDPSVALLTAMTVLQHVGQAKTPRWPARGGLPATTVTRTGDGWLLNGHKAYGTGAEGLAYHSVWAVTSELDETAGEPLIGHVIVPGDTPGITVTRTWDHLGLRASSTHDIVYENVEVPAENFPGVPVSQGPSGNEAAVRRAGVAKLLITRSASTAVQTALAAIGNPGLTRHNPLERHFRDIQCSRIHPPQDDAALIAAGRRTLAAPR